MTKDSALNRRRGGRKQQRFFWGRRNDKISAVVGGCLLLNFRITFGILFGLLASTTPLGQSTTSSHEPWRPGWPGVCGRNWDGVQQWQKVMVLLLWQIKTCMNYTPQILVWAKIQLYVGISNIAIPKIMHQTYKSRTLPTDYKIWRKQCMKLNHMWTFIKLWTDSDNRQ